MTISLTPAAAERVRTFMANRGKGVGLRLGVKQTGCSGYAYVVSYADEISPGDAVFDEVIPLAMSVQLEQSPHLALLSRGRIAEVLQMMKRPPDTAITRDVSPSLATCEPPQRWARRAAAERALTRSIQQPHAQWLPQNPRTLGKR